MMAFHYQAEDQARTACGRVGASYHTHILSDVDCAVCRRSVVYKIARRRAECGAVHCDYPGSRCTQAKNHPGDHYFV